MLTEESRKKMSEKKKGENNPRWNGGNSQYPDHAELKRVRVEVLKKSKGKCEICGELANIVHHIDGDKSNHNINNLITVCLKCHTILHCDDEGKLSGKGDTKGRGRPTAKYRNIYGMTIEEIAKNFRVTPNAVYYWIRNPEKKKWLEENLLKKDLTSYLPCGKIRHD